MTEKPILFSGPMVRAILEGRKTQTRRVVKPQPDNRSPDYMRWYPSMTAKNRLHYGTEAHMKRGLAEDFCPYGQPGDSLWVREAWNTWATLDHIAPRDLPRNAGIAYAADMENPKGEACGKIRPSMFMPRWVSRINLEILKIRVERLQEISASDCIAEGAPDEVLPVKNSGRTSLLFDWYKTLWDSLNAKSGFGWDVNPFVWCVEFKRVK